MRLSSLSFAICALLFCASLCAPASAQIQPPPRAIPSDDFANSRPGATTDIPAASKRQPPAAKGAKSKSGLPVRRKETYKLARIESKAFRHKTGGKPPFKGTTAATLSVEDLGVTFWRLRPPRATDEGPKIAVKTDQNRRELWTPMRVGANTHFSKGDLVRLTFESRRRGYLYVLNAEMRANGTLGKFYLIFPAPANQDNAGRLVPEQFNQVGAGLLVDIPDQAEEYPYFKIEPRGPDYVGELLLLIISPTPLEELKLGQEQEVLNVDWVARLEETWGAEASLYVKGGVGKAAFTTAEQQAQCGSKARLLVREKLASHNSASSPCGNRKRQLTQEDPLPQNIYRVSTSPEGPLIVPVRIAVSTPR